MVWPRKYASHTEHSWISGEVLGALTSGPAYKKVPMPFYTKLKRPLAALPATKRRSPSPVAPSSRLLTYSAGRCATTAEDCTRRPERPAVHTSKIVFLANRQETSGSGMSRLTRSDAHRVHRQGCQRLYRRRPAGVGTAYPSHLTSNSRTGSSKLGRATLRAGRPAGPGARQRRTSPR